MVGTPTWMLSFVTYSREPSLAGGSTGEPPELPPFLCHLPREGGERQATQQQLRCVEEQEDGAEDGLQAQGVGLQQQAVGRHDSRRHGEGQADGQRHLALAQVALGTCRAQGEQCEAPQRDEGLGGREKRDEASPKKMRVASTPR